MFAFAIGGSKNMSEYYGRCSQSMNLVLCEVYRAEDSTGSGEVMGDIRDYIARI